MKLERIDEGLGAREFTERLRSFRAGVGVSLYVAVVSAGYAAMTWSQPHRGLWLGLAGTAIAGALLSQLLPVERVLVEGWESPLLIVWSVLILALITVALALDDGARSPAVVVFFLPLAYAAISYPRTAALVVVAFVMGAYVALAIAAPVRFSTGFIFAAYLAAGAMICWYQVRSHEAQKAELARLSRTDYLTGALNRRGLDERLEGALAAARRSGEAVSLAMFDLNGFKKINDTLGHAAGDELLQWTATVAERELRDSDSFGRVGGDEFAIVLPELDADAAGAVIERLRGALAERVGTSFGVACFPRDGDGAEALHRSADSALYADKPYGPERVTEPR